MRKMLLWILICAWSLRLGAAEANLNSELREAIRKLSEKPNYSWIALPKSESPQFRPGPTEGKTERDGFTYFKLTLGQNVVEAALKDNKSAIKIEDQWESAAELQGERAWLARRLANFRVPASEAEDLLAKVQALSKKDGAYSGNLTSSGVREILLMRRAGATQNSEPVSTKGSVKFWTKGGVLTKYEYNLQGKMAGGPSLQVLEINLTTTVEIKDAGSTQVRIPDEARKKLF